MCGRFEQSHTRRFYAAALGADTSNGRDWQGDHVGRYKVYPGLSPWMMLHDGEFVFIGMIWGYRTPKETDEKKKPWRHHQARLFLGDVTGGFRQCFRWTNTHTLWAAVPIAAPAP